MVRGRLDDRDGQQIAQGHQFGHGGGVAAEVTGDHQRMPGPARAPAISAVTSGLSAAGVTGGYCAGSAAYGSIRSSMTSRGPTR